MVRILLATDGSESARRAADQVVASAAWYVEPPQIALAAVHVTVPMAGRVAAALGHGALESYYRDELQAALAPARAILQNAGIVFAECTAIGEAAEQIVKLARAQRCDLICMGTRGLGAAKGLVLGSTAQKVLHLSDLPVLLVP